MLRLHFSLGSKLRGVNYVLFLREYNVIVYERVIVIMLSCHHVILGNERMQVVVTSP